MPDVSPSDQWSIAPSACTRLTYVRADGLPDGMLTWAHAVSVQLPNGSVAVTLYWCWPLCPMSENPIDSRLNHRDGRVTVWIGGFALLSRYTR